MRRWGTTGSALTEPEPIGYTRQAAVVSQVWPLPIPVGLNPEDLGAQQVAKANLIMRSPLGSEADLIVKYAGSNAVHLLASPSLFTGNLFIALNATSRQLDLEAKVNALVVAWQYRLTKRRGNVGTS